MSFKRKKKIYKKNKTKKVKHSSLIKDLIITNRKKTSFGEKVVKFLIYISLRLVIRPSKWKNQKKNYEIIDRTYKRIVSPDFNFIPSSIAFYLIMSFMPILTLILIIYMIPGFDEIISIDDRDILQEILGKVIPGMSAVIEQIKKALINQVSLFTLIPLVILILSSAWISSAGFAKLIYTESYIYEHRFFGGFWMNRIRGVGTLICFTIFAAIALILSVFLEKAITPFQENNLLLYNFLSYLSLIIGFFIFIFLNFLLFFHFSPRFKVSFKSVLPGTMVSALPITLFLIIFGLTSSFFNYSTYGIFGTIMYMGLASLFITHFIFMGLIVNAAYYKTFIGPFVVGKWTISKK